jgi:DNA-binding NtrC family response regulator
MEEIKVLLVDDEEEFVNSISERLEIRDVKADVAFNGEQALQKVAEDEPNVIVLDLRMPGIDGIEVLRRLKKAHPKIQVIILTGHGTEKDAEQARRLGAFAYLQKPVEMDTLLETVKRAYTKFKHIKHEVDTALMAASVAMAGEVEMAQEMMRRELEGDPPHNDED